MAVARIASRAQIGLHAPLVEIEVHLGPGLPTFSIVGLPATAVKESKERVRAALANAHFEFPAGRITVNLAPADLPKDGCRFDLPIALGILAASGQLTGPDPGRTEFYGELGLGGELKPVRGLLLAATHASRDGHAMIVPSANGEEVGRGLGAEIYGATSLTEVHAYLAGRLRLPRCGPRSGMPPPATAATTPDLADVRGQAGAKRALAIAAAGAHSLLLVGPPGSGKSMLARRLPGLLPPLESGEALEVASIASVSGDFDPRHWGLRPFRAPHHTASASAVVGGGPSARPGEVSLAHRGVLFLDEIPEFDRRVLEALREPLETGQVAIARARSQALYPASFQLVAAMNPCPCGWEGDPSGRCRCRPASIRRYRARLSGPLLDRIDLRIRVSAVPSRDLLAAPPGRADGSDTIAAAVRAARARQLARAGRLNASLDVAEIERWCVLGRDARRVLELSVTRLALSARGAHRLLRIARSIADLEGAVDPSVAHVAEAVQLRRAFEEPAVARDDRRRDYLTSPTR